MTEKALSGVKVIEWANGISAPCCTKLMADLGAEVIKVEPPGVGDEARSRGPYLGNEPHPEKSIVFFYVNTNKLGITLDIRQPKGAEIFKKLIADADVLVKEGLPEEFEELGLGYNSLKAINPKLIMTSFTPYGETGPYRNYKSTSLTLSHACGQGNVYPMPSPDLSREPTKLGGNFEEYDPGVMGIIGIMGALYLQRRTGKGQYVEISCHESRMQMQQGESVVYPVYNKCLDRRSKRSTLLPGGIMPCKDGYVNSCLLMEPEWVKMAKLLGNPSWTEEDWCKDPMQRLNHVPEINKHIQAWKINKTKKEAVALAQAPEIKCPVGPVNTSKDVVESEQFEVRGFFTEVDHPVMGKVKCPGAPAILSKTPFSYDRAAPLLGQDNEKVYGSYLKLSSDDMATLKKDGII